MREGRKAGRKEGRKEGRRKEGSDTEKIKNRDLAAGNNKKHKPCIFCHFWIPQNGREHPQDSHLQNISRERQTSPISGLDFEYISVFPFPTILPKFQDLNLVFSHFPIFPIFPMGLSPCLKILHQRRQAVAAPWSAVRPPPSRFPRRARPAPRPRRRALGAVELWKVRWVHRGNGGGCDQNAQR